MSMLGTKWKLHGNGKSIRPGLWLSAGRAAGVAADHRRRACSTSWPCSAPPSWSPSSRACRRPPPCSSPASARCCSWSSPRAGCPATSAPASRSSRRSWPPSSSSASPARSAAWCSPASTLALVGAVVQKFGAGWINRLMPPIVTGAIVALIGLNLAPAAKINFDAAPVTALITLGHHHPGQRAVPRHPGPAEHPGGRRGGLPRRHDPRRSGLRQDGRRRVGGPAALPDSRNSISASSACSCPWCWCWSPRTSAT